MTLKFKYLLPLLLVAAAFGQSGQRSGQAFLKGGGNFAIIAPSASVYVCVYNSQLACSTQVSVWSDPALSVPASQPIIADVNGVYSYYLSSSQRVVEKVCSIQNQCDSYAVSVPYGASGTAGVVLSVFGRTGAVVSGTGDYSFSQISSVLLHSQLPTLISGDIPNNAANTSGSAASLGGVPAPGFTLTTSGFGAASLSGSVLNVPNNPGFANPMTTLGDMIRGGSSGVPTQISVGSTGQVLTVVAGVPAWATPGGIATPLATPASAVTISLPHGYGICTGTCTVTLPAPTTAGDDFCLWNDVGVSTAITISGHTGVFFAQTDLSAYGTTGGTFTATASAGNKVCMVARDTTHWIPLSYAGTWTAN